MGLIHSGCVKEHRRAAGSFNGATGPTYRKIGGRVVYRIEDLQRWADLGVRTSTSDSGTAAIRVPKPAGR
jgi:hypothetical protein